MVEELNTNIAVEEIDLNSLDILMQQQPLNSNVMHVMTHHVMRKYETYRSEKYPNQNYSSIIKKLKMLTICRPVSSLTYTARFANHHDVISLSSKGIHFVTFDYSIDYVFVFKFKCAY